MCDHTHYGQVANDGRNVVYATRSIGDPEGGAPGYALFYFHGDDMAVRYRSIDDHGPIVVVTHPRETILATGPKHIVRFPDPVAVRTWSSAPVASVRFRIDEGIWHKLEPQSSGRWASALKSAGRTKGEHSLEVEAIASDGGMGGQRLQFMVDPTGRFTAVPTSRPAVSSTAFC